MTTHLVWFRQDLRQHDNLALAAACRNSSARVLALYIATPRSTVIAVASNRFLRR